MITIVNILVSLSTNNKFADCGYSFGILVIHYYSPPLTPPVTPKKIPHRAGTMDVYASIMISRVKTVMTKGITNRNFTNQKKTCPSDTYEKWKCGEVDT